MGVVLLARHGQASFAAEDYDALSPLGFRQSEVLGAEIARRFGSVDVVIAGSMRRQRETADTAVRALERDVPITVDAGWDEYDHRDLLAVFEPRYRDFRVMLAEGAAAPDPRRAFQELWVNVMARWRAGEHDAEYRESWPAFRARVTAALDRTSAQATGERRVLVCTSGGPISVVCAALLGMPDESSMELSWRIVNASITKLVVRPGAVQVSTVNEHGHLEEANGELLSYR